MNQSFQNKFEEMKKQYGDIFEFRGRRFRCFECIEKYFSEIIEDFNDFFEFLDIGSNASDSGNA